MPGRRGGGPDTPNPLAIGGPPPGGQDEFRRAADMQGARPKNLLYNVVFPAFFALAHLALAFAAIFALVAALNFFRFFPDLAVVPLILAQRALAAAAIAARPARDIRRFFFVSRRGIAASLPP